jgi:hypothetical protein
MQFSDIAASIDAALAKLGSMGARDKQALLAADAAVRTLVTSRAGNS